MSEVKLQSLQFGSRIHVCLNMGAQHLNAEKNKTTQKTLIQITMKKNQQITHLDAWLWI